MDSQILNNDPGDIVSWGSRDVSARMTAGTGQVEAFNGRSVLRALGKGTLVQKLYFLPGRSPKPLSRACMRLRGAYLTDASGSQ